MVEVCPSDILTTASAAAPRRIALENPSSRLGPQVALEGIVPAAVRLLRLLAVVLLTLAAVGCSKTYIPNTDVEDTAPNRDVILFCEKYRHALEDKNVGQLLKLMSPGYFEDGGNTKNEDDADFDKIREFLTGDFLRTGSIRYEIRYRRVTFTETKHVYVDYTYAAAWKLPGVKQDEWHHKVADNRLDLVPDGDSYKIVGGM
jgi:hypothetical protein